MAESDLTVYLIAFACEPDRGSEPGVGWVFVKALATAARTNGWRAVLVTRPHRLLEIRRGLVSDDAEVDVMTVKVPLPLRIRGARDVRLASVAWQWRAVRALRRRLRGGRGPAVVHHVTFATEGVPTFERLLRGNAALVFGPAGSTAQGGDASLRRRLRRRIGASILRTSDVLVATGEQVADSWKRQTSNLVLVEPNIVVEPLEQGPVEWDVVIAGQLIARKRVDLALRGIALVEEAVRVAIVGDGPLRLELEALSKELGLSARVTFFGSLQRSATLELLTRAKVLLHTSRQEGAGWVIGEAQAAGAFVVTVAGTGADDAARLGQHAVADSADPSSIADALQVGLSADRPLPSGRWSRDRLPVLLEQWYAEAMRQADSRMQRGGRGHDSRYPNGGTGQRRRPRRG